MLVVFLGYVSTKDGNFRYERSGVIQAAPETIYPYLSDLKMGAQWSPYEKLDPEMKKTFVGPSDQVGGILEFQGNKEAGSGKLEIVKLEPNKVVNLKLTMTEPMYAENLIEYTLTPVEGGTQFSWVMSGDGGFFGKLISTFIDCEALVAPQMVEGIANIKTLVEN